jgi:hypothetical protein
MITNDFNGFKTPKKCACSIPLYFRSCCWNNDKITIQVYESHLHIGQNRLCQPQICYTTPHFFCQIVTLTITLTLHCSSTMVGGHENELILTQQLLEYLTGACKALGHANAKGRAPMDW